MPQSSRIFSARRRRVVGEVDLEHAGIGMLGGIQIVDRDGGVIALRIGDRPLLELVVLDAHHQHQAAGADQRMLLLDGDADIEVVGIDCIALNLFKNLIVDVS